MPVGNGMLASLGIVGDMHDAAVLRRPFQVADHGAVVLIERAPHQCIVLAFDGMFEELLGQGSLRLLVLSDKKQS